MKASPQSERRRLLERVPLFSYLDAAELDAVAGLLEEVRYRKGTTLFREGDEGDSFFVILSGEVEVRTGAQAERVHINRVIDNPAMLDGCQIMVFPGGFSYGDDVAAGKVLANQVVHHLSDILHKFIEDGKLVLGICNGAQILVEMGVVPGFERDPDLARDIAMLDEYREILGGAELVQIAQVAYLSDSLRYAARLKVLPPYTVD